MSILRFTNSNNRSLSPFGIEYPVARRSSQQTPFSTLERFLSVRTQRLLRALLAWRPGIIAVLLFPLLLTLARGESVTVHLEQEGVELSREPVAAFANGGPVWDAAANPGVMRTESPTAVNDWFGDYQGSLNKTDVVSSLDRFLFGLRADVYVRVTRGGEPCRGMVLKMNDESGPSTGATAVTDRWGCAVFTTSFGRRVVFSTICDGREVHTTPQRVPALVSFDLPVATTVTDTQNRRPVGASKVAAYSEAGVDLKYTRETGANGTASFCFDPGTRVRFVASANGAQASSGLVVAPRSVAIALQPQAELPSIVSARLSEGHFERGSPFTLTLTCKNVSAGTASVDFLSAQGGSVSSCGLVGTDRKPVWTAVGSVPRDVPLVGAPGEQVALPVTVELLNSAGTKTTSVLSFPLLNDTTPPTIVVDQPTTAVVDAPSVLLSGAVGPDTVSLTLKRELAEPRPIGFAARDGRFRAEVPLVEGENTLALVARDMVGNKRRIALQFTRPPSTPPPSTVIVHLEQEGVALSHERVAAFGADGTDLGVTATTDGAGNAQFHLSSASPVKFQYSRWGGVVWSEQVSHAGAINFSIPRDTVVTVCRGGSPRPKRPVYVYTETGENTGYTNTTDTDGVARFLLPFGEKVRFRADMGRVAYLSELVTTPADVLIDMPANVTVQVKRLGQPCPGMVLRMYDEFGGDTGVTGVTNDDGEAIFPTTYGRRVMFSTICDGREVFTQVHRSPVVFTFNLPGATTVTVTQDGQPVAAATVTAQSEAGIDLGYTRETGTDGVASFCFDPGTQVRFVASANGSEGISDLVVAPGSVAIALQSTEQPPSLISARLVEDHFERGSPFTLEISGRNISAGTASVDFLSAQGGAVSDLALIGAEEMWAATGSVPRDVPLIGAPGESLDLDVRVELRNSTGTTVTSVLSFPLYNDTTPPTLVVDQPTTAVVDAPTTPLSGSVSADTVSLFLQRGAGSPEPIEFSMEDGRFNTEVPLLEGANELELIARDLVGNESRVLLQLTRPARAPEISFSSPPEFDTPVGTTTLTVAGIVADASLVQFTINGATVALDTAGGFSYDLKLANEGANSVRFDAVDALGLRTSFTRTVYRLTVAPELAVTTPSAERSSTRTDRLTISGTVGTSAVSLTVNGVSVSDFSSGAFSHTVALEDGENRFDIVAKDVLGNSSSITRTVVLDRVAPELADLLPSDGHVTNVRSCTISGRVVDGQSLSIGGTVVPVAADGSFSKVVTLVEGANRLSLVAKDEVGNVASSEIVVHLDTVAPVLTVDAPLSGITVGSSSIQVLGTVDDATALLKINDGTVHATSGVYRTLIDLVTGENRIEVSATDPAGNSANRMVTVTCDNTPPAVAITTPTGGTVTNATSIRVVGTVDDSNASVVVNGRAASVSGGRFEIAGVSLVEGANVITATATDALGNESAPASITIAADFTAPGVLVFDAPPSFVKTDRVVLTGTAEPNATIAINGGLAAISTPADDSGHFGATVLLATNSISTLVATATDRAGNQGDPSSLKIVSDLVPPQISIEVPQAGATINSASVEVVGYVTDTNRSSVVSVGGETFGVGDDGRFGCVVTLASGPQTITVSAIDLAGNTSTAIREVTVSPNPTDDTPPRITVISPAYDAVVPSATFEATVLVSDDSEVAEITIGGTPVADTDSDGQVKSEVTVDAQGEFIVTATDANGLSSSITHRVQVDGTRPATPKIDRVSPSSPTAESTVIVYGSAGSGLAYELTGGVAQTISGTVPADGRLAITVPLNPNRLNRLELTVRSASGLVSDPAVAEVVHDLVAPSVESSIPADGATAVARNQPLLVVFSEAVRNADIVGIAVNVGTAVVTGTKALSDDGRTFTFIPEADLPDSAAVSISVPSALRDLAGNTIGREQRITFTTVDASAPAAPILDTLPARTNRTVLSVSGQAEPGVRIDIVGGDSDVFGSATASGQFSVLVTLRSNATNILSVTAVDTEGNVSPAVTATMEHDNRSLALVSSVPGDGATAVALETPITLTFNKPIAANSLEGVSLVSGAVVPAIVTVEEATITIVPSGDGSAVPLTAGQTYEIVVPATVSDLFGNRLADGARLSFATIGSGAPAAPIVYNARPTGATNRTTATVEGFATPGTKLLVSGGAAEFEFPAGEALIDATGLFTVSVPLKAEAANTIVLRVRNSDGLISAPTTALKVVHDSVPPTVLSTVPASGATGVDPHGVVYVEFSEAIQPGPLAAAVPAIRLVDADNAAVAGNWILNASGRGATFYHPLQDFTPDAAYLVRVGTSVRDLAGNALAETFAIAFTTGAGASTQKPATPILDPLPSRTTAQSVTVSGSAPAGAVVRVFGGARSAETTAASDGRFSVPLQLVPLNPNSIAVIAVVDGVESEPAKATVVQVKPGSGVRILAPLPDRDYYFGGVADSDGNLKAGVTVAGVLDEPDRVTGVTVDGQPAIVLGRYFFRPLDLPAVDGASAVSVVATLDDSTTITESVSFRLQQQSGDPDTLAPIPHFIFPEEGDTLNGEFIECLVTVEEGVQLTSVDIDRVVAHETVGNVFFLYAKLAEQGANTITVRAVDASDNEGTASVGVSLDSVGFENPPTVTTSLPAWTGDRVITVTGTGEAGSTIIVVNGLVPVRTVVATDGSYSINVPLNPNADNNLQLVASDAAGNLSSVVSIDITQDDTPPEIVSTSPVSEATGIAQNTAVEITFTEPLAPESVTAPGAVALRSALNQNLGSDLACNVLLSADGKTIRIVPSYKFLRGDTITVALAAGIADLHGFSLGAPYAFQFNTVAHQTTVSGVVVDEKLQPLANVKVGIKGSSLSQLTSSFGTFLLDDAPVGDQLLTVDARPDVAAGIPERTDGQSFNYLEFFLPVRLNVDNSLGRPVFMVATDKSTATQATQIAGAEPYTMAFTPAEKDLAGFSIQYVGGTVRFANGTTRGEVTATRIDPANIPDRLPSGAIPHFMVELGPDGLSFSESARLTFPNVYGQAVGEEVIVFHFKYGIHNYSELGRAKVGADGRIVTDAILNEGGFVGIVPADASYDLTRNILEGTVVDADGNGLAGISVNAIAGDTYVVTDANGRYSIPLPDVRLAYIRTYATVTTNVGAKAGESPSLVFESEKVALNASGVTQVPAIVVDSFFLAGDIRYLDADGGPIQATGLAYSDDGRLVSIDLPTANGVEILVYRRLNAAGTVPEYDSEPYMRTTASLAPIDPNAKYKASYLLSFLGSLNNDETAVGTSSGIPKPGDIVKIVAFDRKTGFYGETDLTIPAAADINNGNPLDIIANIDLRPPQVSLDINRVFFLDGIRRRANLPNRGIAFTDDEFVEVRTIWRTPVAVPLPRAELALTGRLRVRSVDYQTDYGFTVRGGEQFRVLELREALVANRLSILQRDTDVGIESFTVSRDGSFAEQSLVPLSVRTSSYGLQTEGTAVDTTPTKTVDLYILQLALSTDADGLDFAARFLPKRKIRIAGHEFETGADGIVKGRIDGATGAVQVGAGDSLDNTYGETLAPHINELDEQPPGLLPSKGGQGTRVLITGRNFSPVATDNKVDFNGAAAVVDSATETQLVVTVPDLASSGDVTVTVAGKKSNGVQFDFLSIGINNGSFEDGTLRGFTVEGSGRVVERWNRVLPTHRQYMAFLDTMGDPRDGVSTLTSDAFEVPAGMQTLLFDYNFVATGLLKAPSEVLEFQILPESGPAILVDDLFATLSLSSYGPISGFEDGGGFRTAGVLVEHWAGTGERIRVRIALKGRGALPVRIPGTSRFDHNPIGLGNNQGTGVFVDNFRLSSGYEIALPAVDVNAFSIVSDGATTTITLKPGTLPEDSRVFIVNSVSGAIHVEDIGEGGGFAFVSPFEEGEISKAFLVSYGTPDSANGRMVSEQVELGGGL